MTDKICKVCYTPRIDKESITQGEDVYCSMNCYYKDNEIKLDTEVMEELEETISELNSMVENLGSDNSDKDNEINDLSDKIYTLKDEIMDSDILIRELKNKIDNFEDDVDSLTKENKELKDTISDLEDEAETMKGIILVLQDKLNEV